jgi:hypothetical protein
MKNLIGLILMVSFIARASDLCAQGVSNVSARIDLSPTGSYIFGFVVPVSEPNAGILLRAVGPSLTQFGITNPAPSPSMQLFDSKGQPMVFVPYETFLAIDWGSVFASIGAFPLTGGKDVYYLVNFPPGNYTVMVSDSSGHGGTVLFELYVVPYGAFGTVMPASSAQKSNGR